MLPLGWEERRDDGHTFPVLLQISQLIVPLCDDPQRILEEGAHDQEAANGGDVSVLAPTTSVSVVFL